MTAESLNALALCYVPKFTCTVNTARKAVVAREVKLTATELALMTFECVDQLSCAYIPNLRRVVKRRSK